MNSQARRNCLAFFYGSKYINLYQTMAIAPLTETDIIEQIYSMYENDDTTWSATSAEYITARNLSKAAIIRWEYVDGTLWPELFTKLSAAATGTKTTTAGDYDVTTPDDMRIPPQPGSYVRLSDTTGIVATYVVIPLTKVQQLGSSLDRFCYFTGNASLGYTLNFNPNVALTTGLTISYEYYRNATYFTAPTSTTEMANPFFIVHYVLHRLYKSDGQLSEATEEGQILEGLLQQMQADVIDIGQDVLSSSLDGFGV